MNRIYRMGNSDLCHPVYILFIDVKEAFTLVCPLS
jgi:hypothetical protein